jgi:hypothetical protein
MARFNKLLALNNLLHNIYTGDSVGALVMCSSTAINRKDPTMHHLPSAKEQVLDLAMD